MRHRKDNGDLTANQVVGQDTQSIRAILRPAIFDGQVPALRVAGAGQTVMNRRNKIARQIERSHVKITDHRYLWTLRPRHGRPSYRAAEPRNELPPLHSITSSASVSSDGGTVRPSILAA